MQILLFDWASSGHHPAYVRRVAEALLPEADIVAAVPEQTAAQLEGLDVRVRSLGESRPAEDRSKPLRPQARALADRELDLFEEAIRRERPDHAWHLYGDGILRRLVGRPALPVATTLTVFYPMAHYPREYGSRLTPRERLRAWYLAWLVARWRKRSDAHALFTLDARAAARWSGGRGAPAFWFPEPPVSAEAVPPSREREGCILFGALSHHKGLERLVEAAEADPELGKVTLAGSVMPGFEPEVEGAVARLRRAGVPLELRLDRPSEREALGLLAGARCAVLPYPRHGGMSRILLEACAVGTPVVVHDYGLLAALVREHDLGLVVDCGDPAVLAAAVRALSEDPPARYAQALARFAEAHSPARFRDAVRAPFPAPEPALRAAGTPVI